MSRVKWQRARQPEQKQQRRQDILDAAAGLFDERGFEGVSLNAIARHAGLAKSNLYRYFGSREEIFLGLLIDDYAEYVDGLDALLGPLVATDDPAAVAAAIASAAAARPRMCALTAVLPGVIEQNLSEDSFLAFKTHVLGVSDRIARLLRVALPSLSIDRAYQFQRYVQALVASLWSMSTVASKFPRVMERPEFSRVCVDFEADLRQSVTAVLRGLLG
ncbi:MAG: TetR family transcriptional regulator [Proteobacteria bacterium]|nr:TetR family transcriptional regulator [Pseudomonadota bacterium]